MFANKVIQLILFLFFIFDTGWNVSAQGLAEAYTSQLGQDKFIYENFFKNKPSGYKGIFLDIGASDGFYLSNTHFFEKTLGWQGICIEANPRVFKDLIKNRSCICLNYAIADRKCKTKFLDFDGEFSVYGGLVEKLDARRLPQLLEYIKTQNCSFRMIEVECQRLDKILEEAKIFNIDFLSLDVEGGEYEILAAIDFKKIYIDVITVENNCNDLDTRELLEKNGYKFIVRLDVDDIYKKI